MVSKAADKSRARRIVAALESAAMYMSLTTFNSAVSVECDRRYADCKGLSRGVMCIENLAKNSLSRILLIVERLEIGRRFTGSFGFRFCFLSRGMISAILNSDGKVPSVKEQLAR